MSAAIARADGIPPTTSADAPSSWGGAWRRRAALAVGALFLLLLGALAATGIVADESEGPAEVAVPFARIGDHATYQMVEPVARPDINWSFRVVESAEAIDQASRPRNAIVVDWNDGQACYDDEYVGGCFRPSRIMIDAQTRQPLRVESTGMESGQALQGGFEDRFRFVTLGPSLRGHASSDRLPGPVYQPDAFPRLQGRSINLPGVAFQGETIRAGDGLPVAAGPALWTEWAIEAPEVATFQAGSAARLAAAIDGRVAVGIETQGAVEFLRIGGPQHCRPFLYRCMNIGVRYEFEVTNWFSDGIPYPVRIDVTTSTGPGSATKTSWALAGFRPGDEYVAWGEVGMPAYPAEKPGAEWAEPGPIADGSGQPFVYSPASALSNVIADPSLTTFAAWRQEHPDFFLAGAEFHNVALGVYVPAGQGMVNNRTWRFVFASPDGSAFLVSSTLSSEPTAPINLERGEATLPFRVHARDVPARLTTVGESARIWRALGNPDFPVPNYFAWGLTWAFEYPLDPLPPQVDGEIEQLSRFVVGAGRYAQGSPTEYPADEGSVLVLDAASGKAMHRFDFDEGLWPPLVGDVAGAPTSERSDWTLGDSAASGRLSVAGLAVASLLGAALVAYLYPALKYLFGQMVWALPGYAKLRKQELLKHKVREDLVALVREDPGITPPELHRAVGGGWSTVVYHLSILEKNKLVSSLIDGRHKRFFPVDTTDWTKRGRLAALKNARTKELFGLIAEEPGVVQKDLAQRTRLSAPSVMWHMRRLEGAGLIGRDKVGRHVRYYPTDGRPAAPGSAVELP